MKPEIKIFVCTFGAKCYKGKYCIPFEVGADIRNDFRYKLKDNTDDNISYLNPYYGELTGLYWIWKNYEPEDKNNSYVGFYHYRRKLKINPEKAVNLINSGYDFICANRKKFPPHRYIQQFQIFLNVLEKYDEGFYTYFISICNIDGSGCLCPANMFFTKYEFMVEYCAWLFPLLVRVYSELGEPDIPSYYKRYNAFFSERILAVWILYTGKKLYEVDVMFDDRQNSLAQKAIKKFFPYLYGKLNQTQYKK